MPFDIRRLLADSLTDPRAAARRVLNIGLGAADAARAVVALACVSTILSFIAGRVVSFPVDPMTNAITAVPLLGAIVQAVASFVFAGLTCLVGRFFGGYGSMVGALDIVIWLSVVTALLQVLQIVFLVILPPLSGILSVASLIWVFWAFSNGAAELHGFASAARVFGVTVLCMLIFGAVIAMAAAFLGVGSMLFPGA